MKTSDNISLKIDDLNSNDIVFESVELNEDFGDSHIDTDVNYFSFCNDALYRCQYYLEDSFNKVVRNVRIMQKNYNSFLHYLENLDLTFSVIGLSETWLNNSVKDLYAISGYNDVHLCSERRGGGVSLYIDKSIEFHQRLDLTLMNDNIECLFIEMGGKTVGVNNNVIEGVIYRPPNTVMAAFNDELCNILYLIR